MSEPRRRRLASGWHLAACSGLMGLTACAVGPTHQPPSLPQPETWKSAVEWASAQPKDQLPRGAWWQRYDDTQLNQLEAQALTANPSLLVAQAQLRAARAQADIAGSPLWPTASLAPDALRSRLSASRPTNGGALTAKPAFQNQFDLPLRVNYEPDLFGATRRSHEQATATAEASAANLESVRLIISAEVASDYYALREADEEVRINGRTLETLTHELQVIRDRHQAGSASGFDLAAQEAQVASVKAELDQARSQRDALENALASLCGAAAPEFKVEPVSALPAVPTSALNPAPVLPSALLQRRPDVAAAERRVAAANAAVGVAQSAFFPTLNLNAAGGYQSVAAPLVAAPNLVWGLGVSVVGTVFDGGQRKAGVRLARAEYDITVAQLRQTSLNALAETQSALTALSHATHSADARAEAVKTGQTTLTLATRRYEVGAGSDLELLIAEQNLLTEQRALAQALTRQRLASVQLVTALAGDY